MTMNKQDIIHNYGATNVSVDEDMVAWMRSNHAGETGAVWIYKGAKCISWNSRIIDMANEHGQTEQQHLVVIEHLVAPEQRSRLLPLWRLSGFMLGFLSGLCGYRAFCITIDAVETFVEQHYQEQIQYLAHSAGNPALQAVLERCCAEEVEHQHDAASKHGIKQRSLIQNAWRFVVGTGSNVAVHLAKAV